jgi:hypothetical protein
MSEPLISPSADSSPANTAKSGVPIAGGGGAEDQTRLPSKYQQARERARRQRKKERERVRHLRISVVGSALAFWLPCLPSLILPSPPPGVHAWLHSQNPPPHQTP